MSDFSEHSGKERNNSLSGMFRDWYLEYASYVILERAVPHIDDGLKPVQRRILHSMQTLDDGKFNKVANIVGNTMQYHPHGDASIGDALVQLGQKELLIDTQGNWGNILTGDSAAAPRYIEARLSEFAIEAVYSPKITEWTLSYDGRKNEPVTLPVKFPLLLAQGVEGIAVGLSSKILPHNFNEILDAAIAYLHGESFKLIPDFQTGGYIDAARYNDGARGGSVKVRAKIEKIDNKTLAITELPYGKTTSTLISSIISAQEKGKIKIRKVDDNTAKQARIIVHLIPGTSSDKAIDALYAFTDCEVSISPNCCVIKDQKPDFLSVSQLLKHSVNNTMRLFTAELNIKLNETREAALFASLEKIFIEKRMYKDKQIEEAPDMESALMRLDTLLTPYKSSFFRELTNDDLMRLWEIKMGRILKFNSTKSDEKIARLNAEIEEHLNNLANISEYTVKWYRHLKDKYGASYPRRTVVRGFDSIEATKVAEANKRLYYDSDGDFIGTALKDKEMKFICSDLDDVIIIYEDGTYKTIRVQDKVYIGGASKILHIGLFKKGDRRTIYNVIYRNGKGGPVYKKRFFITGLTREKEYNITKGIPGSQILYLSVNHNGEAEVLKVTQKKDKDKEPRKAGKPKHDIIVNFAELDIKGKESLGNLVSKQPFDSRQISVIERGKSTLGGREVWFDPDVLRLNYDGRGESLGEFAGDDLVLVIYKNGEFITTDFSDTNHYDDGILLIEKFDPRKVWTLALSDATLGYPYLKRFSFEAGNSRQRFVGSDEKSSILLLTSLRHPILRLIYGGIDASRPETQIDATEFIAVKRYKAKGKRLTTFDLKEIVLEESDTEEEDITQIDENIENPDTGESEAEETITETTEDEAAPKDTTANSDNETLNLFNYIDD